MNDHHINLGLDFIDSKAFHSIAGVCYISAIYSSILCEGEIGWRYKSEPAKLIRRLFSCAFSWSFRKPYKYKYTERNNCFECYDKKKGEIPNVLSG